MGTAQRKRLLVVDDDEALRTALSKILEKAGYSVTLAANADEALARFEREEFDLVLTDYRMPGKSGLTLARDIVEGAPQRRPAVVVMTAFGDVLSYLEAINAAGVQEYINKPIGRHELLLILDSILRGRGRRDKSVASTAR